MSYVANTDNTVFILLINGMKILPPWVCIPWVRQISADQTDDDNQEEEVGIACHFLIEYGYKKTVLSVLAT